KSKHLKDFAFPYYTSLEIWETLTPGDAMRERKTRNVAKPNDPVPKERRYQRMAQGMPPVRRLRRLTLHGTRAERDLRVRGRYGSAGVRGREPCKPGIPHNVVTRLGAGGPCSVHRPASVGIPVAIAAKGSPLAHGCRTT